MVKNILCFGDSNTYGANPEGGRFDEHTRWTGVLADILGNEYRIIEEGCSARTSLFTDDLESSDVGKFSLPIALCSHRPLDLVIIMLGTNDMKHRFNLLPVDIAIASNKLGLMVKEYNYDSFSAPKVLIISPIEILEGIEDGINTGFSKNAPELSKSLAKYYEKYAKEFGFEFLDAAKFAKPSEIDMLHMDAENHKLLAKAIANKVKEIL